MQFDEVLKTFSETLTKAKIRFAVIGGLAVHAWGRSRLTKDVDLVVDASAKARVLAIAESLGYETLHVTEGYSNHVHGDPGFGRVDFMYVKDETADQIFAAVTNRVIIGDVVAPVASPEHLAMMKALSMKNVPHRALFEGEDVRVLLNVPGVDRKIVREYFRRHGLLELYDAIDKAR